MRLVLKKRVLKLSRVFFSRKCRLFIFSLSTLIICSLFFLLLQWNIICLNVDIENQISVLCEDYHLGKVSGSMCKPLCDDHSILLASCQSKHRGKVAVFTALWNDTLIVIKSDKAKPDYMTLHWTSNGSKIYPNPQEFQEMITQSLKINLGITKKNIFPSLFPFFSDYQRIDSNQMINMWNLAQDFEYVHLMVHKNLNVFPEVLGSCGTFYGIQYAKPLSELVIYSDKISHWISRVHLAKLILELLALLDSVRDPLHICDVKLEHFGLLEKRLVILDADTLFSKSIVSRNTADQSTCSRHEDCDLFDCRSLCNSVINICDTPVVNNNLQVICQKLFIEAGLLTSRHLPVETRKVLEECANPYSAHGRQAAPQHLQDKLLSYFNELLSLEHLI